MKKLLAILVICVLAVSLYAVDNPFTFGFSNQITLKGRDKSQMGKIADTDTTIGSSYANDYNVTCTALADEMNGSASITIAEIYTLGTYLTGFGEYGLGADAYRVQLKTGLTNSIKVVPDYLTIGINVEFINRWEAREKQTTNAKTGKLDETALNADLNGDGDQLDTEVVLSDKETKLTGQQVRYVFTPQITLGGSIPDSGFSWSLGEKVEMDFDPANWKDSDPTFKTVDGHVYKADGSLNAPVAYDGVFDSANFITSIGINFEFFHFFAPENFTGTLKLSHDFKIDVPYSYYIEYSKKIENEGTYGLEFGLAGVSFGIFAFLKTEDYLNSSAPLDGENGSFRNWAGTVDKDIVDDMDATSHARPNAQLGPKITFGYTKEWFSFGTAYKGFLDGLRKYDEDGKNGAISWNNEFEIYAKFAL